MKQSVEVEIAGQKLVIKSDEGPRYVQELADYVDAQLRQIAGGRSTLNLQRIALLVAIQIADELFREKDLHRQFRMRVDAKLAALDLALSDHEARMDALEEPSTGGGESAEAT
jgi:cell division protein ZapA